MTTSPYVYQVTEVVKVTDGDTFWCRLDVGFRESILVDLRLSGYDCPERHKGSDREKAEAVRATSVTTEFLSPVVPDLASELWVRTEKDPDVFGRWLGDPWREDATGAQRFLGVELRAAGLASVWPTRWRDEYDTA